MPDRLHLSHVLDRDSEEANYFISCARVRNVATISLFRRLVQTIVADQLIPAILDDDGIWERRRGEHKFRG